MSIHFEPVIECIARAGDARRRRLESCVSACLALALTASSATAQSPDLAASIRQTSTVTAFTNTVARFEVTVRNGGWRQSNTANLRVDLPAGFTAPSAGGSPFTCATAPGSTGTSVTCQSGVLATNQSRSFALSATTPRTITGDRQVFTLTAVANPGNMTPEGTATANNTATLGVAVETAADLQAAWTGSPTSAIPGTLASYRAILRNTGDRAAQNPALRVAIPLGQLTFQRFESNGFSGGCGQPDAQDGFTCRAPSLAAGASVSVGIATRMNPLLIGGDRLLFQATAAFQQGVNYDAGTRTGGVPLRQLTQTERDDRNNVASLVTTIAAGADLRVEAVSSRTLGCNEDRKVEGVFRVSNRGSSPTAIATEMRLNRPDPCGAGAYSAGGTCNCFLAPQPSDHRDNCSMRATDQGCPINSLAPGATRTFTLYVLAPAGQRSVTVEAVVDAANRVPESNEQNNRATINHSL